MNNSKMKCDHCGAIIDVSPNQDVISCPYCNATYNMVKGMDMENNPQNNFQQNNYQPQNNPQMNQMPNNGKKKTKHKKKNTKKIVLYIFFILIIIVSGIIFYIDYNKKAEDPEIYDPSPSEIMTDDKDKRSVQIEASVLQLAPDVDLNAEREKYHNNDIIGRLEIPNLFNVLVVKGTNNEYYLNHSISKEYDIRGSEFIDYRNNVTDKQVNVYGHNSRDVNIKVAFLKLEQFLNKPFFDNNPYIVFQHDNGKDIYKILAIKEIRHNNNEHMIINKTGAEFVQHVVNMTSGEGLINSREVSYNENSEIIVLQTCSHHWDNAFYIITAVKL